MRSTKETLDPFAPYARYYDLDYADFDGDQYMIQQFAARCGSPILELGCGTGRLLLPLAHAGYQVTGVDLSAAMLDIARHKVAAEGLEGRVILLNQDMHDLDLDRRFTLAFASINSFMHMMTSGDQLAALGRIRKHLSAGGILLLDLFNPDPDRLLDSQGRLTLEKVMTDPHTGRRVMKFHTQTVDLAQQTLHVTLILDEVDGEGSVCRTLFPFSLRYLFRAELELLLEQAGFEIETVYGSYDLDEFSGDSEKMIAVARMRD